MSVDVASSISNLLYEHDSVIIPGLGAIVSTYKPAVIDHVQGLIQPPSKTLSFNPNLSTNDKLVIQHIQQQYQLPYEKAEEELQHYVSSIKTALDNREIIVFPKVGRIYVDYENNLQFLQDNTNFNRDVFGLPTIQYYPILRQKDYSDSNVPAELAPKKKRRAFAFSGKWLATALPIIFTIVICGIGLYIYTSQQNNETPIIEDVHKLPTDLRLNEKPFPEAEKKTPEEEVIDYENQEIATVTDEEPEMREEEPVTEKEPQVADTEQPSLGPGQRECIIIIGQFKSKEGVASRIEDIINLGFTAYTDKESSKGLTRVGVQFIYEDKKDVDMALRYLRKRFDMGAFVLKK